MGLGLVLVLSSFVGGAFGPARAQPAVRIVVSVSAPDSGTSDPIARDAILRKYVVQELEARGFVPVTVPWQGTSPGDPMPWLETAATSEHAALAIGVLETPPGVVMLWVVDRTTRKRLNRSLHRARLPSIVALAAGELIDASLAELYLPRESVQDPFVPPVPPPLPRMSVPSGDISRAHVVDRSTRQRWHAGVALGMSWPVLRSVPIAPVVLRFGVRFGHRLAAAIEGSAPVSPVVSAVPEGHVRTFAFHVGATLDLDVLSNRLPVRLAPGVMVAAAALRVDAVAKGSYRAFPGIDWGSLLGPEMVLERRSGRLHVAVHVRALAPLGLPKVTVLGRSVQDYRLLWVTALLEVGTRW